MARTFPELEPDPTQAAFIKDAYDYKYNGKEWQNDLGLNMYAMDWRQYDPAVGRWIVVDPVIHYDYSPYSGINNNPSFWSDPSGLAVQTTNHGVTFTGEDAISFFKTIVNNRSNSFDYKITGNVTHASGPGANFLTMDDAAIDFGMQYNGFSITNKVELSSAIYKFKSNKKFSYTKPVGHITVDQYGNRSDQGNAAEEVHDVPKNTILVGHIHTHGNDDGGDIMGFSGEGRRGGTDMERNRINAQNYGSEYRAYVVVPDGTLWKYTPYYPGIKSLTEPIRTDMPSDMNSKRRNKPFVSSNVTPQILPTIYTTIKNIKPKY